MSKYRTEFRSLEEAALYARRKARQELEEELRPKVKEEIKKGRITERGDPYGK